LKQFFNGWLPYLICQSADVSCWTWALNPTLTVSLSLSLTHLFAFSLSIMNGKGHLSFLHRHSSTLLHLRVAKQVAKSMQEKW